MRRWLGVALCVVVPALMAVTTAIGVAGATGAQPFAGIPEPGQVAPPTYVGTDDAGLSIALSITSPDTAVAYVCDGTGKTGVWLTGSIDDTGTANLKSADGASTLTYDLAQSTGELTIDGSTSTFTLERATGVAGLYRDTLSGRGKKLVLGWILHKDGLLVGEGTIGGKPAVATTEDVSEAPPSGGSSTATTPPTTAVPVPQVFAKGIRCFGNGFRAGFNAQQRADATAAGDTAGIADANVDGDAIKKQGDALGCGKADTAQTT